MIPQIIIGTDELSSEKAWTIFKRRVLHTLSNVCGTKKYGRGPVKETPWSNDDFSSLKMRQRDSLRYVKSLTRKRTT